MNKDQKTGIVLTAIGIFLFAMIPLSDYIINSISKQAVEELSIENIRQGEQADADFDFDQVQEINASSFTSLLNFSDEAIGVISIPEVSMELPIFKGLDNDKLMVGAGTMKENQIMGEGNYALAGHNWRDKTTLFSPLHRVKKGMIIYVKDLQKEYEYRIDKIIMVDPNRLEVIDETETATLTLVTCNHDGTERLIIQAALVNS